MPALPERIVCLTEEPTEVLYALGQEHRIVGISGFTVRPPRARQEKPKVSAFTSAKIDRILALNPDLAIGFSDIQADIAAALIKAGVEVWIANHRSERPTRRSATAQRCRRGSMQCGPARPRCRAGRRSISRSGTIRRSAPSAGSAS
jgi:ABC-type Fe3+-hydroxamate transport system substrate-binding protein